MIKLSFEFPTKLLLELKLITRLSKSLASLYLTLVIKVLNQSFLSFKLIVPPLVS